MDTPHRAKHPGTFKILANLNLSDNFKRPTLGPHHIVQGTVADTLLFGPVYRRLAAGPI